MKFPSYTPAESNPTEVAVTSLACKVHGWIPGHTYPVMDCDIVVPDANGFEIYVLSTLRGHWIWLSSAEYKIPGQ